MAIGLAILNPSASAESGRLVADTGDQTPIDGETYSWAGTEHTWYATAGYAISNLEGAQGNTVENTSATGIALYADNHSEINMYNLTVISNGIGAYAAENGSITIEGGSVNSGSTALFSAGENAAISGRDLEITGTGTQAGVIATSGGSLYLSDSTLTNAAGSGIFINTAGTASLENLTVTSADIGINISGGSISDYKHLDISDTIIRTSGSNGYGLYAAQGSTLSSSNLDIVTQGGNAAGIYVSDGGSYTMTGATTIVTHGDSAHGILANNAGSTRHSMIVMVTDGTLNVTTTGSGSHAVSTAPFDGNDNKANRIIELHGKIDLITEGPSSHGLYSQGNESHIYANGGGSITTKGADSHAINAGAGTTVNGAYLTITTEKSTAVKLDASGVTAGGAPIADDSTSVNLMETDITSASNGVELSSSAGVNNVSYTQTVGSITAAGHVFQVMGGNTANTSSIELYEITAKAGTNKNLLLVSTGTNAQFNAAYSTLTGNLAVTDNNAIAYVSIDNSVLTGIADTSLTGGQINFDLNNASIWNLAGHSTMTSLELNSGSSINFTISGSNDFTDIMTAVALLQSGTIINVALDGYTGVSGDSFQLINASSSLTVQDGVTLNLGSLTPGLTWHTDDFAVNGTISIVGQIVPEPSTALLALLGLPLACRRRRR